MVFSEYMKLKVLYLWSLKYKPPAIAALLEVEGIQVAAGAWLSLFSDIFEWVSYYLFYYCTCISSNTGTIARQPGSGRRSLITAEVQVVIGNK